MSGRWFPDDMPRPAVDAETQGWWQEAARQRLVVQECGACGHTRHPPSPVCPDCHSESSRWRELAGRGRIYTYTVVHRPVTPSQSELPFVVAAVELDGSGGIRMLSNLVEADPAQVRVGLPVELVWEPLSPELALPRFRPAQDGSG